MNFSVRIIDMLETLRKVYQKDLEGTSNQCVYLERRIFVAAFMFYLANRQRVCLIGTNSENGRLERLKLVFDWLPKL